MVFAADLFAGINSVQFHGIFESLCFVFGCERDFPNSQMRTMESETPVAFFEKSQQTETLRIVELLLPAVHNVSSDDIVVLVLLQAKPNARFSFCVK